MKKNILTLFLTVLLSGLFFADLSFADMPKVRVLVAENQKQLLISVKGDYVIKALPSLQILKKGRRLVNAPVTLSSSGIKFQDLNVPARGVRVEPLNDRDLFVGRSRFRGRIDILKNPSTGFYAINELPMESYLYGVLHHEVSSWWPMEALKAQAIAARTYALYEVQVSKSEEYDLKSNTSSQVYGGSTTERYRTKRAVDMTAGKILTYEGKVFPAYFHATCAGVTTGARELWKIDLPPLAGGAKCSYCRISPHYHWEARVSLSEIEDKMRKNNRAVGRILEIRPVTQTPSHRVGSLKIAGTQSETVMAAKDLRIWIGGDKIRSTNFTVALEDDAALFHGKGWGHGVGLCQWGALGQSLLGKKYEEILGLYYPGAKISSDNGKAPQ